MNRLVELATFITQWSSMLVTANSFRLSLLLVLGNRDLSVNKSIENTLLWHICSCLRKTHFVHRSKIPIHFLLVAQDGFFKLGALLLHLTLVFGELALEELLLPMFLNKVFDFND